MENLSEKDNNDILTYKAKLFAQDLIGKYLNADYSDLSFYGAKSCALIHIISMLEYTKTTRGVVATVGSKKAFTGQTVPFYDTFLLEVKHELIDMEEL